ncbi:unnamed protein product [Brassica oleracea var. botrytis]
MFTNIIMVLLFICSQALQQNKKPTYLIYKTIYKNHHSK